MTIFDNFSAIYLFALFFLFHSQTNQRGGNNSDMYEASMFNEGSGEIRIVNDTFDNDFPEALFE